MAAAATDHHAEPYLWRLLVDRRHQRRGVGERAVRHFLDLLRAEGHRSVLVSYVADTPGTPEPFYRGLGFVPTGDVDDGEHVARLAL
jgi:GNAT superfamily N-acetyltransferase